MCFSWSHQAPACEWDVDDAAFGGSGDRNTTALIHHFICTQTDRPFPGIFQAKLLGEGGLQKMRDGRKPEPSVSDAVPYIVRGSTRQIRQTALNATRWPPPYCSSRNNSNRRSPQHRQPCLLSNVQEVSEGAVDISLYLIRHGVRRLQVLPKILQSVPVEAEKFRPCLHAQLVRLQVSGT